MGKLGNWIDGLTDEQKDRVVRAQSWFWQSNEGPGYHQGTYCIVGAAVDVTSTVAASNLDVGAATQYDLLCRRFPGERIVRACKQRAAATMSTEVETPDRETVPA